MERKGETGDGTQKMHRKNERKWENKKKHNKAIINIFIFMIYRNVKFSF